MLHAQYILFCVFHTKCVSSFIDYTLIFILSSVCDVFAFFYIKYGCQSRSRILGEGIDRAVLDPAGIQCRREREFLRTLVHHSGPQSFQSSSTFS